ncbi:hypothetical protein [Sorangium sp. So ce233]|uniref:hypothetical protein n=1 Tax=Sorangium sp. So ce233 TaxID=3133290 RepID=UPI003F643E43
MLDIVATRSYSLYMRRRGVAEEGEAVAKRMTKGEAARKIAEILAQLPDRVDLEEVTAKAERLADYERDLRWARKDWPQYNKERVEEGLPLFATFREYLLNAKEVGEWRWPIPAE